MSTTAPPKHGIKRALVSSQTTTTTKPQQPTTTPAQIPAVTVVVRVRPSNERERELAKISPNGQADLNFLTLSDTSTDITLDPINDKTNWYRFDHVYGIDADQNKLFIESAKPIVDACLQGYNATILAYGQTGSGKTFSMIGPKEALTDNKKEHLQGIIPRALSQLFTTIQSNLGDWKYSVECSYVQIYKEKLQDLLSNDSQKKISIIQGEVTGVYKPEITSSTAALKIMEQGFAKRQTASTKMNAESSRSHAIFTVYITATSSTQIQKSKLHFVDLAGSECAADTGAKGETQMEAASINKSLSTLSQVIRTLAEAELRKKSGDVDGPYRDSKLTLFLQNSFGKGNPLCLIANISPSRENLTQSKSTLTFASNARSLPKTTKKPQPMEIKSNKTGLSNGDNNNDDILQPYFQIIKSCGGSSEQVNLIVEQYYQISEIWKRQRTNM